MADDYYWADSRNLSITSPVWLANFGDKMRERGERGGFLPLVRKRRGEPPPINKIPYENNRRGGGHGIAYSRCGRRRKFRITDNLVAHVAMTYSKCHMHKT